MEHLSQYLTLESHAGTGPLTPNEGMSDKHMCPCQISNFVWPDCARRKMLMLRRYLRY